MKLEKNDMMLLFSSTDVPDIFFNEYLPHIPGDYLKVYLYILFLSKYNKEIKLNDLSKKLELSLKCIQDGLKYLEEENLLTKKNTGFIINNLQERELHSLYTPKVTISSDDLKKSAKSQARAKAIESINNQFFQGIMPLSWYSDIELWFKKYHFDEEVMNALFSYCFNKSALHKNYVQTVADAWSKSNIKTYADLDKHFEKQEKLQSLGKNICKKLGYHRSLTQFEEAYVEKWTIDYMYSMPIIDLALKKTTSKTNPNFEYINTLLTDWHDRNLKTTDEINSFLLDTKNKNKNIKDLQKTAAAGATANSYKNFTPRDYTNLNEYYDNI
ncbi:MAG: DnaD domain protein [Clostridia bacterium]|nr:DnaD domain protein [Clostridia bacterium]